MSDWQTERLQSNIFWSEEDQQDNNGGENVNQADSDPQKGGSVKNEQKGTIKTTFHPKMELAENNLQKTANQTKRTCHRKKCLKESKGSTHGQSWNWLGIYIKLIFSSYIPETSF